MGKGERPILHFAEHLREAPLLLGFLPLRLGIQIWLRQPRRCFTQGRPGRAETLHWLMIANRCSPALRTHGRFGQWIEEVEFPPGWHFRARF